MRPAGFLVLAGMTVLASGCSGIKVRSDFDPQANFSQLNTYSWLELPGGNDFRVNNALVDRRIRTAVDNQLAARGYRKGTDANADFKVGYHVGLEGKMDVSTINSYYGYGHGRYGRWGYGGAVATETRVREYTEGTLVIDIVDATSNELVWRGTAEGEVRENADPDARARRIDDAVSKILDSFPPQR